MPVSITFFFCYCPVELVNLILFFKKDMYYFIFECTKLYKLFELKL